MKKYFLLAIFLSSFVFDVSAQDNSTTSKKENTIVGIKAGLNIANFVGDDAGDAKSFIGFNGGLFIEFKVSDKFYIQPEFLYSIPGSTDNITLKGYNIISILSKTIQYLKKK